MDMQTLNRNIRLHERLDRAYEMLQSLRDRAYPQAQNLDGMPHGTDVGDKVGNLAIAIADLSSRIEELEDQLDQGDDEIRAFANTFEDERLQMAIQVRFINGFTWSETAELLGPGCNEGVIKRMVYDAIPGQTEENAAEPG